MDQPWTLAQEMQRRGMNPQEFAKFCRIDYATMGILLSGGQTMPSIAIKVARACHLTPEQAKKIGKALNKKTWLKENSGLPRPKRIDVTENWYDLMNAKTAKEVYTGKSIYLDTGGVALWMWKNGRDVRPWLTRCGMTEQKVNTIKGDETRLEAIKEIEARYDIPPNIAETERCMKGVLELFRFNIGAANMDNIMKEKGIGRPELTRRYMALYQKGWTYKQTYSYICKLLANGGYGNGLTIEAATELAGCLEIDLHKDAQAVILSGPARRNWGGKEKNEE